MVELIELNPSETSHSLALSPDQLSSFAGRPKHRPDYWRQFIAIRFQDSNGVEHAPCQHKPKDRRQAHIMNVKLGQALLDESSSKLEVFFQLICPGKEGGEHLHGPMQLLFEFIPTREHLGKLAIKCTPHTHLSDSNRRDDKTKKENSKRTEKRTGLEPSSKSRQSQSKRRRPNPVVALPNLEDDDDLCASYLNLENLPSPPSYLNLENLPPPSYINLASLPLPPSPTEAVPPINNYFETLGKPSPPSHLNLGNLPSPLSYLNLGNLPSPPGTTEAVPPINNYFETNSWPPLNLDPEPDPFVGILSAFDPHWSPLCVDPSGASAEPSSEQVLVGDLPLHQPGQIL